MTGGHAWCALRSDWLAKSCWLVLAGWAGHCESWAAELSGTSTSLVYRGPSTSISKPSRGQRVRIGSATLQLPGQASDRPPSGVLRLVDARSGREVAAARYNDQVRGFFFQMPAGYALTTAPVCLAIRGADGRTLPLRDESAGDDGYEFRHVPWEEWLRSKSAVPALQSELVKLQELQAKEEGERLSLHQKLGFAEGTTPPVCQLGPSQAPPPRPAWAVAEQVAGSVAHDLCLQSLKTQLAARDDSVSGRWQSLVPAAGLIAQSSRSAGELAMPAAVRLTVSPDVMELMTKSFIVGPRSLEYEQALEGLRKSHSTCRQDLIRHARDETLQWEAAVKAAANHPQTAKATCEQSLQRIAQLSEARIRGLAYRQALEKRLHVAQEAAGGRKEINQLEQSRCTAP